MGHVQQECRRLLSMNTFSLELFLLFYSTIYGLIWLLPGETFLLDTYQFLRGYVSETALGWVVLFVSLCGLFMAKRDMKKGRILILIIVMVFWLSLGAAFIIATPMSATGYGFLFCGISAGWAAARAQ